MNEFDDCYTAGKSLKVYSKPNKRETRKGGVSTILDSQGRPFASACKVVIPSKVV